jgi:polyisoprenyl-teichoic acid--peptidoglycan teichoic acid transferase
VKSSNRYPSKQKKSLPKKKKGLHRGKPRWLWLVFSLTGVAMLSATAGALLAVSLSSTPLMQRQLSPEEASVFAQGDRISTRMNVQLPELTRPVNILVLGTKVLTSEVAAEELPPSMRDLHYQALVNSFDGLSDTMLLLRFHPDTKKMVVLSIPRDTQIDLDGYGTSKINAANSVGGPALSARAVSDLLGGVGIDRYVRVNVQGVEKLIDALGGVTVYVPKDMKYQDDSQHLYINLKAGKRHLNGNQALQLLRYRYDENGDIGRIQRQQMVMRSLMEQALNPTTIARLPKILSVIQSHIDTNLSVEELFALVGYANQIDRSNVKMLMVPGDFNGTGENEISYWLPDYNRIQSLMSEYFDLGVGSLATTEPSYLRIAIQDSTRRYSSVQTAFRTLQQAGYSNINVDTPWNEPLQVTRIVAQQGDTASAERIQRSLGLGEIRVDSTGNIQSDITIQLGEDWLQKQSKVNPQNPDPIKN